MGALPNAPRLDEATEALLDAIYDSHAGALDSLAGERDQARDKVERLETELRAREAELRSREAELRAREAEVRAREAELSARDAELCAIRGTVSFRVGRVITWLPRKLRGGVRCYRDNGAKYTFFRLLYHLRLAPKNDDSAGH